VKAPLGSVCIFWAPILTADPANSAATPAKEMNGGQTTRVTRSIPDSADLSIFASLIASEIEVFIFQLPATNGIAMDQS
jgi:hypothetical protein